MKALTQGTPKWSGKRVAIFATGPSLTLGDCEMVRSAGFYTVGVNSAWKIAPWIDVLYAGDARYWKANIDDIEKAGIQAKRFSRSSRAEKLYQAKYNKTHLGHDYNSGELAIELACQRNASLIVLLGFDASVENGVHFHGLHTATPNPNADRCSKWLLQFARIPQTYKKARIVNCSRQTAIKCFPRDSLENVIAGLSEPALLTGNSAQGV